MPFTVSHVAAVLPARAVPRLPLAGLAVGAMSPDLEYLIHGSTHRTVSHTPLGILVLDLPISLVALALATIAAPGLGALVPRGWPQISQRLSNWSPDWSSPAGLLFLVAAIVIGAANHVLLDEFTHRGGLGTTLLPVLDRHLAIAGFDLRITSWLQYGLSVVGIAVLGVRAVQWIDRVEPTALRRPSRLAEPRFVATITAISLLIGGIALTELADARSPGLNKTTAVVALLGVWRAMAIVLVGTGVAVRAATLIGSTQR